MVSEIGASSAVIAACIEMGSVRKFPGKLAHTPPLLEHTPHPTVTRKPLLRNQAGRTGWTGRKSCRASPQDLCPVHPVRSPSPGGSVLDAEGGSNGTPITTL